MLKNLHPALRRRGTLIAAGTAVLVAVGGGTTAAFAAGTDTAPSASPSTSTSCSAPHLRAILRGGTPGAFRADLKQLRSEPKGQRAGERKVIRQKALSGAYGERVERLAHLFGGGAKGHGWLKSLPAALQTDLKALRALPAKSAERTAKAEQIATNAVNGTYGTAIQTRAKAVQARVQARCTAQQ